MKKNWEVKNCRLTKEEDGLIHVSVYGVCDNQHSILYAHTDELLIVVVKGHTTYLTRLQPSGYSSPCINVFKKVVPGELNLDVVFEVSTEFSTYYSRENKKEKFKIIEDKYSIQMPLTLKKKKKTIGKIPSKFIVYISYYNKIPEIRAALLEDVKYGIKVKKIYKRADGSIGYLRVNQIYGFQPTIYFFPDIESALEAVKILSPFVEKMKSARAELDALFKKKWDNIETILKEDCLSTLVKEIINTKGAIDGTKVIRKIQNRKS